MFNRLFDDPVPNMSTAVSRVEAGLRFLDDRFAPNWLRKIDVDKLNIASPTKSVLGQLLWRIPWRECRCISWVSMPDCIAYGFSCGLWDFVYCLHLPWVSRSFHRLNEAWRLALLERLRLSALPQPRLQPADTEDAGRGDSDQNHFTCAP